MNVRAFYCMIDMGKLIFRGKLFKHAVQNKRDDTANNLNIPCRKQERNYKRALLRTWISQSAFSWKLSREEFKALLLTRVPFKKGLKKRL